jgi:hypothetical protein
VRHIRWRFTAWMRRSSAMEGGASLTFSSRTSIAL